MTVMETPQVVGCWDLRGIDLDSVFASDSLSDTALTAAYRTAAKFSAHFPGWFLYRRVVGGIGLFDRQLEAWAVTSARLLSRSRKDNGRDYIGPKTRAKTVMVDRGGREVPVSWIAQAGRDGLDFAIYGRYHEGAGLVERAKRFGVHPTTYQSVRDPVAKSMWIGLETFRAQLHAEYWRVRDDEKRTSPK